MIQPSATTPSSGSNLKWVMISLALMATVLNYVHRLSFTYLSADGELRRLIPNDAFGYLAGVFAFAYLISNAFSGFMIDKLGTRIGYAVCMAFWTTAGLVHAFARTPLQFGVCRFLLGIGEAGNWPAGIKLTGEWFPPHQRSTASGIFNSGSALGAVVAPPLVAVMGTKYGWQSTFIILGLAGYAWIVLFWFIYYTPKQATQEVKGKTIPPLKLLRTRFVSGFLLAKIFLEPSWYFITFWLGRYLADVYNWDLKKIGFYAALPFVIADIGNIAGGYFTQFIIKRGVPIPWARKIAVGLSGGLLGTALLCGPLVISSPLSALIVFGIAGFGYTSYTANALALPADVVPKSAAASVWGLASMGNGIGTTIFQSLSGVMVTAVAASQGFAVAYNYLFVGFGLLALVGMLIMLFGMGPFTRNEELHRYVSDQSPVNQL